MIIPFSLTSTLKELCEGKSIRQNLQALEKVIFESPVILAFLKQFDALPQYAVPFFAMLIRIVEETFAGDEAQRVPNRDDSVLNYFPSLPKLYNRGRFLMDGKKVRFPVFITPSSDFLS